MNDFGKSVCNHFKTVGVVCPPYQFQRNLFTVGAIDILDHNPSSTTAQGSFHGTRISLFQFPTQDSIEVVGQEAANSANQCSIKTTPRNIMLPNSCSIVPPVSLKTSDVDVPAALQATEDNSYSNQLSTAMTKQNLWLEHCGRHLDDHRLTKGAYLSWAAYHASIAHASNPFPTLGGLLPLFDEKAATPAMGKHAMDVQRKATAPTGALYQASIWISLGERQVIPTPSEFGWKQDEDHWSPLWTKLPEASKACSELLKCGCKKGCSSLRCKCVKANLPCTALCLCSGGCQNTNL